MSNSSYYPYNIIQVLPENIVLECPPTRGGKPPARPIGYKRVGLTPTKRPLARDRVIVTIVM